MKYTINRQLICNPEGKIKYKKFSSSGKEHYHLGIWVEANSEDLDRIEQVTYTLHPSFKRQERVSTNRKNKFSITIWTWGMFDISVAIELKDGSTEQIDFFLSFQLPEDDSQNYIKI